MIFRRRGGSGHAIQVQPGTLYALYRESLVQLTSDPVLTLYKDSCFIFLVRGSNCLIQRKLRFFSGSPICRGVIARPPPSSFLDLPVTKFTFSHADQSCGIRSYCGRLGKSGQYQLVILGFLRCKQQNGFSR